MRPGMINVGEWIPGEWTSVWYEEEAHLPFAITFAWRRLDGRNSRRLHPEAIREEKRLLHLPQFLLSVRRGRRQAVRAVGHRRPRHQDSTQKDACRRRC